MSTKPPLPCFSQSNMIGIRNSPLISPWKWGLPSRADCLRGAGCGLLMTMMPYRCVKVVVVDIVTIFPHTQMLYDDDDDNFISLVSTHRRRLSEWFVSGVESRLHITDILTVLGSVGCKTLIQLQRPFTVDCLLALRFGHCCRSEMRSSAILSHFRRLSLSL